MDFAKISNCISSKVTTRVKFSKKVGTCVNYVNMLHIIVTDIFIFFSVMFDILEICINIL